MTKRRFSRIALPSPKQTAMAAGALAVLALGGFVREQLPQAADVVSAPMVYVDQAPKFGATANSQAILANSVNGVTTHGVWLLIRMDFTPSVPDEMFAGMLTAADGRRFEAVNSFRQPCGYLHTGVQTECILAFELPADAVQDATLQVGPPRTAMAPRASVAVNLDAERVKEMEAASGAFTNDKVRV